MLKNHSVVKITKMFWQENLVNLTVINYRSKCPAFKDPCDSSTLGIFEIDDQVIQSTERNILLTAIHTKMVKLNVNFAEGDAKKTLVLPLLHHM